MENNIKIPSNVMIGKVFRKRDSDREERVKFATPTELWHRFVDQENNEWSSEGKQTYRMRSNGDFEIDWGNSDVFLCQFLESSSQFVELNPRKIFYWELYTDDDYSDRGSSSSKT
jgi:hypothetical protein